MRDLINLIEGIVQKYKNPTDSLVLVAEYVCDG